MHATPFPSPSPTSARRAVGALAAVSIGAVAALLTPVASRAAVFADVVSTTPVTAFVPVQRSDCGTVVRGTADASATDPNSQPAGDAAGAGRCRTVTVRTQRVVAYDVVYEIGGERQTVRLDRDPGPKLELGVVAQAQSQQGTRTAGQLIGRPIAPPVERAVGQPVPAVVDDGGPVEAAPTYRYGEQAPIGAGPVTSTTVIVGRPYGAYGAYGAYGPGWYDPYPYGYGYGYPWFGPSIGIGFYGGGSWGHGGHRWDGGSRPFPKDRYPHGGSGRR